MTMYIKKNFKFEALKLEHKKNFFWTAQKKFFCARGFFHSPAEITEGNDEASSTKKFFVLEPWSTKIFF